MSKKSKITFCQLSRSSGCILTPSVLLANFSRNKVRSKFFVEGSVGKFNCIVIFGTLKSVWLHCSIAKNGYREPRECPRASGACCSRGLSPVEGGSAFLGPVVAWIFLEIGFVEVLGSSKGGCVGVMNTCMERLQALQLLESRGVEFTTYQLDRTARQWWQTCWDTRPVDAAPLTWAEFTKAFMIRFVPGVPKIVPETSLCDLRRERCLSPSMRSDFKSSPSMLLLFCLLKSGFIGWSNSAR